MHYHVVIFTSYIYYECCIIKRRYVYVRGESGSDHSVNVCSYCIWFRGCSYNSYRTGFMRLCIYMTCVCNYNQSAYNDYCNYRRYPSENALFTHPHPIPPLEGEGNSLSLRERVRVRVGIFIPLCEPQGLMTVHSKILFCHPRMPLSGIWFKTRFPIQRRTLQQAAGYRTKISPPLTGGD